MCGLFEDKVILPRKPLCKQKTLPFAIASIQGHVDPGDLQNGRCLKFHTHLKSAKPVSNLEQTGQLRGATPLAKEMRSPIFGTFGIYGNFGNGSGGRYRIRTYDFHRVKMALYR